MYILDILMSFEVILFMTDELYQPILTRMHTDKHKNKQTKNT